MGKALLDGANRSIRQIQSDIADARSAVNNMQTINGRDMTGKRQLESSIHTLQAEVDGMLVAAKNAEDKAKKAMVDAARLADELRAEQEHVSTLGTGKNSLSNALGELEGRLSDAENIALKSGKTAMAKLEGKIRELEAELAGAQSRTGEATKAYQRAERKAKELSFAQGEDKKNQDRMSELASKLQMKIKTYKQQIERLRRLPPSTWPSSARPSRSWRRLRREPSLLWFCKLTSFHMIPDFDLMTINNRISTIIIF